LGKTILVAYLYAEKDSRKKKFRKKFTIQCLPPHRYANIFKKPFEKRFEEFWTLVVFSEFSKISQKFAKRNDLVVGTIYV